MKIVSLKNVENPEVVRLSNRQGTPSEQAGKTVKKVLSNIQSKGHTAAISYAKKFDKLSTALQVSEKELNSQAAGCEKSLQAAINKSISNVSTFHKLQREKSWTQKGKDGVVLGQLIRPLRRVGVYIPGGMGIYPSTAIMNIVPAQVAGVKEIAAVTPVSGKLSPAIAYALKKLKVDEIYKIGGAQAVAMLAYGTQKVKKVDKIIGPGNNFVALAKKELFGLVDIDMIAGPSEILVMADDSADPDWIAADLLSQAEHGSGYEAAICITTSPAFAKFVSECVMQQVESSPRKKILETSLERFGRIFVVPDWQMGCDLANRLAPEHLELMMKNPDHYIKKIQNAGAIFCGPWSTEPVGDYLAGPNHVLPTNGSARFFSPLGVYDFYKRSSFIQYTRSALQKNGKHIMNLAMEEGFVHHAEAVRKRMG